MGAPGLGGMSDRSVSKAGDFREPDADRDFLSQEAGRRAGPELLDKLEAGKPKARRMDGLP